MTPSPEQHRVDLEIERRMRIGEWRCPHRARRVAAALPLTQQAMDASLSPIAPHPPQHQHQDHAMKLAEMMPSAYLKQADIDQPYIVTITKLERKDVSRDDEPTEMKWVVHFKEFDKPMVLNTTNLQLMAQACDSDESDDWLGQEVIVYVDSSISFGGKLTGGLRIRKHQEAPPVAAPKRIAPPATPARAAAAATTTTPVKRTNGTTSRYGALDDDRMSGGTRMGGDDDRASGYDDIAH